MKFRPTLCSLETRDNPSFSIGGPPPQEYVWDYYGTGAGLSSVDDNWVGDVAPPASGARVRVPSGTGSMEEDHLTGVYEWTQEVGYDETVSTDGLVIDTCLIESGTWQATGDLEFRNGLFRPVTGYPIVFDNIWGGDINFAPTDSSAAFGLTFDGTLAEGSDFGYRGVLDFYSGIPGDVDVLWKNVGWMVVGFPPSGPTHQFVMGGTGFGLTIEGENSIGPGDLFHFGGESEFYLKDGSLFQVESPVEFVGGVNAVVGKGSILKALATQSVEVYPGVDTDVSVLVSGAGTNLSLYGNLARVIGGHTVAVIGTGLDAGVRLFDSGVAGVNRYKSVIVGSLVLVGSDLQFSDTDAKGIFHVTGSLVARYSSIFVRANLGDNSSDTIWSASADIGTASTLGVYFQGTHTAARQYNFLNTDGTLTGTFASTNWHGFGSASLSQFGGVYFIDVSAP